MGNVALSEQRAKGRRLTELQKNKLTFDFETFFDLNKDGVLSYQDFLWAKDKICYMSGWKIDSEKYKKAEKLFKNIWISLEEVADSNHDGKITKNEWLTMWETYKIELMDQEENMEHFFKKFFTETKNPDFRKLQELGTHLGEKGDEDVKKENGKEGRVEDSVAGNTILPTWLHDYLVFRFDLLDRTCNGVVDLEEYQYVLGEFGVKEKDSKACFTLFTDHSTLPLDFQYFVRLFEEFYLSDDPTHLGNFVNGKLDFSVAREAEGENEDEESIEEMIQKMNDDLMAVGNPRDLKQKKKKKVESSFKIFEKLKKCFS